MAARYQSADTQNGRYNLPRITYREAAHRRPRVINDLDETKSHHNVSPGLSGPELAEEPRRETSGWNPLNGDYVMLTQDSKRDYEDKAAPA